MRDEEENIEQAENEGLYEHHSLSSDPGQEPMRIDKFLVNQLGISRNKIQNAAKAGCILVDGDPVKQNYKIKSSQTVSIVLPKPPVNIELIPEAMDLDIVYEDDDLLIVNKPRNMVVHPGSGNFTGTLVNGLIHHFANLPEPVQKPGEEPRPGLIHRLDKDTTGLMVVAKTELAMTHLAKQFFDRTTYRRYWALVWGDMEEDSGTVEGNLGRHPRHRKLMHVFPEGEEGKHAVTHWKVVERIGYVNLVECRLETGRTHQIRVHMQYIGHPVFGDPWYGGREIVKGTVFTKYRQFVDNCFKLIDAQALHARSLGFIHPTTGKEMRFDQDLPEDFAAVLDKWRRYVKGLTPG